MENVLLQTQCLPTFLALWWSTSRLDESSVAGSQWQLLSWALGWRNLPYSFVCLVLLAQPFCSWFLPAISQPAFSVHISNQAVLNKWGYNCRRPLLQRVSSSCSSFTCQFWSPKCQSELSSSASCLVCTYTPFCICRLYSLMKACRLCLICSWLVLSLPIFGMCQSVTYLTEYMNGSLRGMA